MEVDGIHTPSKRLRTASGKATTSATIPMRTSAHSSRPELPTASYGTPRGRAGWRIIPRMKPKIPWLPHEVQPGQPTEVCPRCGVRKLMPWTLRRDPKRVVLLRTWVCTACQTTEEREEAE